MPTPPPGKRRWFRYRLRTLLIVTFLACLPLDQSPPRFMPHEEIPRSNPGPGTGGFF
jgi:hypothetical protein